MKKNILNAAAILLILAGMISCGEKDGTTDIPLDYVNCPCEHETEFIEKRTYENILMFDAAKTSIDEIHEIALGQGIGLYVFVDFETQVALLRIVVHNLRYTYDICNFPFNRISQTISKNGLSISVAGNAHETCELSGGVIQYEYYNIILTSLKIQQS
jgi:hypothetical protein